MIWKNTKVVLSTLDNSPPKYITDKVSFSCPVSPYIMWYRNLVFSECPLNALNRDMNECSACSLRGSGSLPKKKKKRRKKHSSKLSEKGNIKGGKGGN
jgi:hypothetical protein